VQHVAEGDLDDARKFLLVNLIETYFELAAFEEDDFHRLLSKAEYREAQKMELTWADRMKEEGRLAGKRETLLQQLTKKFGSLPEEATTRVNTLESIDELNVYLDRVLTASSLEEMGLTGGKLAEV
jgi:predicted transposase YdaD